IVSMQIDPATIDLIPNVVTPLRVVGKLKNGQAIDLSDLAEWRLPHKHSFMRLLKKHIIAAVDEVNEAIPIEVIIDDAKERGRLKIKPLKLQKLKIQEIGKTSDLNSITLQEGAKVQLRVIGIF